MFDFENAKYGNKYWKTSPIIDGNMHALKQTCFAIQRNT